MRPCCGQRRRSLPSCLLATMRCRLANRRSRSSMPAKLGQAAAGVKSIGEPKTIGDKTRHNVTYADPKTGLEVVCELTQFADFPAGEWVLRFTNRGTADTPILQDILPLDVQVTLGERAAPVLHYGKGSGIGRDDFLPIDKQLAQEVSVAFPTGKLPSQMFLPYFNLQLGGAGIIAGIRWSGAVGR